VCESIVEDGFEIAVRICHVSGCEVQKVGSEAAADSAIQDK